MAQDELLQQFYETIDSEFADYEASRFDKDVGIDLKNNIANCMLKTFKIKYGEESDFYMHSSMVYMTTINDCLNSYIKLPVHARKERFHSYFLSTLTKAIRASIQQERESSSLGITFGEETEKSSKARIEFRDVQKIYDNLQKYDESLTDEEIIQKIVNLTNISEKKIRSYILLSNSNSVSAQKINHSTGDIYSPIDDKKDGNFSVNNTDIPEELFISQENMKSILNKIEEIYSEQKETEEDDGVFLSKVITYKILDLFEPNQNSKTYNSSGSKDCISYLPPSYDLKGLLINYEFIDKEMITNYFSGIFPLQKKIERSKGSVNNKWKQFNEKLLKKYRSDLEDIMSD